MVRTGAIHRHERPAAQGGQSLIVNVVALGNTPLVPKVRLGNPAPAGRIQTSSEWTDGGHPQKAGPRFAPPPYTAPPFQYRMVKEIMGDVLNYSVFSPQTSSFFLLYASSISSRRSQISKTCRSASSTIFNCCRTTSDFRKSSSPCLCRE